MEHVLGSIRDDLIAMGIPIEQSNPEYAAGQAEVNVHYSEALSSADNVVLFPTQVKEIAQKHGYLATFMAKPFIEESGNSIHTHDFLWKNGKRTRWGCYSWPVCKSELA